MQNRNVEIIVGFFMLAGVLALVYLSVQVSGLSLRGGSTDSYRLVAYFNDVSGLTQRAKVTVDGVLVGRVTSITLDPVSVRAKVEMSVDAAVDYITEDSIAAIKTAGVLGEKYVSIAIGGSDETLADGDEIFDTQSALVLEDLIGKVLSSTINKKADGE
ncbi:MAG TPA: outer membrane lipid asymmetry maintenance protein MlaD [Spongiibacteraceae bacterium]|jgi:phospholipid/cholesterol/gamma-HCH transport system substrate-binding protein|nr:outer membrane lipid asymmetry maintenance protein MlaD [Spongiibacteraceae bacterium]HUH39228.1 outer membrane lipid asymmetry maintenance protein MlaD [Spongiibacteraceae bacterium]